MPPEPSDRAQQRSALLAATMASFLTPFLGSAVNVALPAIGSHLHMNAVQLTWVAQSFLLGSAVCLVPFGRLADLVGRKRVFVTGMILFTLASLGCGVARSMPLLIAFRGLQGVTAAMIFGTGLAILTSVYPPGERGRVIGLNASAVYLGLSVGPFVGGILTRHLGWPSVFLVTVPLGIASLLVASTGLRQEHVEPTRGGFDTPGTLLYSGALVSLMLGLSSLPETRGLVLLAAGFTGAMVFVARERRVAQPMLDVRLLGGNAVFAWSNVAALINYSATYAVTFLLSLYLQYMRGFDPAMTGLVLLAQSATMAAVSPFSGRLSDRFEPRFVASGGMALTVIGLVWLSCIGMQTSLAAIVVALAVLGTGFGLFSSPNTNAVMSSVTRSRYGIASATLGTMRLLGQTISMGLAAATLAVFVGRTVITPALHDEFLAAMRLVFAISAGLCITGIFASLARGNVRHSAPP